MRGWRSIPFANASEFRSTGLSVPKRIRSRSSVFPMVGTSPPVEFRKESHLYISTPVWVPDSPVRSFSLLIAKYMAIASCLLGITGFVSPSIASVRTARYYRSDDLFWNRPFLSPPCQVKKDVSDPIRRLCVRDDSPDISSI